MKQKKPVVNYKKIKHDLVQRDTNGDNRFRTRTVTESRHKPDKYKSEYFTEDDDYVEDYRNKEDEEE